MFTQHAAEAENADNAAEQKRQMNKRVRYGEIVQVTWNKCKYEGIITNCTINPQNSVNVHVYIINRIYLLHVNDLGHVPIFFTLVCFRITRIFTYIGKKIIRKTDQHRDINTNKCVEGSNYTYRILLFGLFYILKFLYQEKMEYFIYYNIKRILKA